MQNPVINNGKGNEGLISIVRAGENQTIHTVKLVGLPHLIGQSHELRSTTALARNECFHLKEPGSNRGSHH